MHDGGLTPQCPPLSSRSTPPKVTVIPIVPKNSLSAHAKGSRDFFFLSPFIQLEPSIVSGTVKVLDPCLMNECMIVLLSDLGDLIRERLGIKHRVSSSF